MIFRNLISYFQLPNDCLEMLSYPFKNCKCSILGTLAIEYKFSFYQLYLTFITQVQHFISLLYLLPDMRRDVQEVFRMTPHEKQVMMFSATLAKEIRPVCKKFMQDVIIPPPKFHCEVCS